MKLDELILLVKQGESENLEFRKTTGQWTAAAKTICAFLNGNGNPIPEWEERAGSVVITFFPISEADTPQVTMEVARLLPFCLQPVNRQILQKKLGFRNADHFRKAYILPAIKGGWIEMTIPDKPKSRLQKYMLTSKGRKWLEEKRRQTTQPV